VKNFLERKYAVLDKLQNEILKISARKTAISAGLEPPVAPADCPLHNGRFETLWRRFVRVREMTTVKPVIHFGVVEFTGLASANPYQDGYDSGYAAGKADGARAGLADGFAIAEDNAEISTHDGWHVTEPTIEWGDARKKLSEAIARRGSEGK
jgi:hypothetical protein